MDYFTEYFEDAGPEGEAALIQELGTPKEAAYEILDNLITEKRKDPDTLVVFALVVFILFILGIFDITASLSGASLISGAGLFSIGISILAILAVFCFCKWIVLVLAHFIQNMSRKRSVK